MSTILPPPPTPSPQPTVIPAPAVSVPSPPAALLDLANGTTIKAEVVALLTRGLAEVETDIGNFQIRSNVALRVGAELDLQILKNGPQPQLAIRGVDGHALPGQSGNLPSNPNATGAQAGAQLPQTALDAERTAATSPQVAGANSSPAARPAPLVVGALFSATLLPRPPGSETHPPLITPLPTAQQAAVGTSAAPLNAPTTTIVQSLTKLDPAGTRVELRLIGNISSDGKTQVGVPPPAAAQQGVLSGTVSAFTPSGHPIVETSAGLLSLDATADVRVGSKLTFAIVPPNPPRNDGATGPAGFLDTFIQKRSWPALEQVLTHLAQKAHEAAGAGATGPAVAANLPVPQANSHLAHNLLSATAALADGDIRTWLGDLTDALEQEQPDLFRRLNDDFAQLARIVSEPRTDDWRTALLPFFNGINMEPVQMHMRGEKAPKQEKKEGGGSRFIIDLKLSNLGRFQLDGFMKERGETKTLDLIVRTDDPLPQRMRRDLNRIFTDFTDVSGLIGGITFQAHAQFVDVPLPRGDVHRDGVVV